MNNKMISLNAAEGVFFPAFDKYLCHDEEISIDRGAIERLWDSLSFRGGKQYCIHWQGEVALGEYDRFIAFLSLPPNASVSGSCIVDHHRQTLFSAVKGGEAPVEPEGVFQKGTEGKLTDIFLEINSEMEEGVTVLSWLGVRRTDKLDLLERTLPSWQSVWEQELLPGIAGSLWNSLVLSEEDGKRLKEQVNADTKQKAFFTENAETAMAIKAEAVVREYVPVAQHLYRFVREKDRGRAVLEGPILNLAVAGWILEEPRYSYQAAKLILALLPMKWFEGPVCEMEGSSFHHVCFTEEHLLTEMTLAVGFLGGIFKDSAWKRIVDKVKTVGEFVRRKCLEPGYRNYMNQGIVGNRGVMLGAAFLQRLEGGSGEFLEEAYLRHTNIVNQYLTEDGHCAEGGNYFEYSFSSSILLWHVYARYKGCRVQDVVPKRFLGSGKYLEAMMSANDRNGVRIPINCGGGVPCSTLLLVFMTMVCGFPEGNQYLLARFASEKIEKTEKSFDFLFYLYYKEQVKLHPYYRPLIEEISFQKEGLLSFRNGNTKLVVTAERNPLTGHFHEDRGGIILEADGDTLLPELGTTSYADPLCLMMDKKEYHNLSCPADLKMAVESETGKYAAAQAAHPLERELLREELDLPEAKVLYGEMRKEGYAFAVATGMLYGDGISGVRSGIIGTDTLTLKDTWSFPREEVLLVTFLSYHPWVITSGKQAESGRLSLKAEAMREWTFETEELEDFGRKPVFVLKIRTRAERKHEITSFLSWRAKEVSPTNSGRENTLALQALLNKGGMIRIEKAGVYEVEDTLVIGSHTHLFFGAGVFLKRSKTSTGSFAMINRGAFTGEYDTNITIEGLHLITGGVEARSHAAIYGLTGEVSFFRIKQLRITDFTCLDLPRLSFGIHICTFEDILIERVRVEGRKDAIHLGTGKKFVIRHGLFKTFDDPIALNAHDYAVANPQMGWIEDGLIEDCYDLEDEETTGYFCRILAGAWCDWKQGMEIQNSDTVVSSGRVYRAFQQPDGKLYCSETPPSHKEGLVELDGINWVMVQETVTYQCGCRNIHFKDIHLQKERETALSIHFDRDRYSRSVYPGAVMPVQENLVFENITIENKIGCLVRSITPVNTIKILNSVLLESRIELESLMETEEYQDVLVLMMGNTYKADGEMELVRCGTGRSCSLVIAGSLVEKKTLKALVSGNVVIEQADIPIEKLTDERKGIA